ncbi:MAG: NAD(P)H-dependent oxidoreductase [Bacteroidetes bacterium]|nr:NAD(P)H-dependent oxidoreductase [Bacteroidota bacterium]
MQLIEHLNWRYAVKRMTGAKVPEEKVQHILEATRLSASSVGLQPYKIIVVSDEETKRKLSPLGMNQPQLLESSHILVFAAQENITAQHIEDYIALQMKIKNAPAENFQAYKETISNHLLSRTADANFNWAARQAYIALGTAIIAAAEQKVDATPMEGFNPAGFDEILGLHQLGLKSVALLVLGYRDEANDFLANAPKVRKDLKDLIVRFDAA